MKARIYHHRYHTCSLCLEDVFDAVIFSKARTATVCLECWAEMVRAAERAEKRDLFSETT